MYFLASSCACVSSHGAIRLNRRAFNLSLARHDHLSYISRLIGFFKLFFASPFPPFLIFLLLWLTFFWTCFQFKILRKHHREEQFLPWMWTQKMMLWVFHSNFWVLIIVYISGSTEPITLIWESLERCFPHAEVEYRWSRLYAKVMTLEVKLKGQSSSLPFMANTGVKIQNKPKLIFNYQFWPLLRSTSEKLNKEINYKIAILHQSYCCVMQTMWDIRANTSTQRVKELKGSSSIGNHIKGNMEQS